MKNKNILFISILTIIFSSCGNNSGIKPENSFAAKTDTTKTKTTCADNCEAKSNSTDVTCKLTTDEMQKRRTTVLDMLRKQTLEKKELTNGYAFKFDGSDKMFDKLTEFIKTERTCCDFFTFDLSVAGDKNEIWLSLTGPKDAKEMIKSELEL